MNVFCNKFNYVILFHGITGVHVEQLTSSIDEARQYILNTYGINSPTMFHTDYKYVLYSEAYLTVSALDSYQFKHINANIQRALNIGN